MSYVDPYYSYSNPLLRGRTTASSGKGNDPPRAARYGGVSQQSAVGEIPQPQQYQQPQPPQQQQQQQSNQGSGFGSDFDEIFEALLQSRIRQQQNQQQAQNYEPNVNRSVFTADRPWGGQGAGTRQVFNVDPYTGAISRFGEPPAYSGPPMATSWEPGRGYTQRTIDPRRSLIDQGFDPKRQMNIGTTMPGGPGASPQQGPVNPAYQMAGLSGQPGGGGAGQTGISSRTEGTGGGVGTGGSELGINTEFDIARRRMGEQQTEQERLIGEDYQRRGLTQSGLLSQGIQESRNRFGTVGGDLEARRIAMIAGLRERDAMRNQSRSDSLLNQRAYGNQMLNQMGAQGGGNTRYRGGGGGGGQSLANYFQSTGPTQNDARYDYVAGQQRMAEQEQAQRDLGPLQQQMQQEEFLQDILGQMSGQEERGYKRGFEGGKERTRQAEFQQRQEGIDLQRQISNFFRELEFTRRGEKEETRIKERGENAQAKVAREFGKMFGVEIPAPVLAQRILEKGGERLNRAIAVPGQKIHRMVRDMISEAASNPEGEMNWYQDDEARTGTGMEMLQALARASGISSGTKGFYDIEEKEKKQETRAEEATQEAKDSLKNRFEHQKKMDDRTETRDLAEMGAAQLMSELLKSFAKSIQEDEEALTGKDEARGDRNVKKIQAFLDALKDAQMTPEMYDLMNSILQDPPKPMGF